MAKRLTLPQIKMVVANKNGTLLTEVYKTVRTRLKISCNSCNEIFILNMIKIKKGTWCPFCNLSKPQKLLYDIIKQIYPKYVIKINYRKFVWLKTTKGKQEIDIFVYNKSKTFTLAIEYDGEQHFMPVKFGNKSDSQAEKDLLKTQKMDIIKNRKIKKHIEDVLYFVRFNYTEELNKENVIKKLTDHRVPL